MKYIDSEKLISEIERLKEPYQPYLSDFEKGCMEGRNDVLDDILFFITSLQQEQPMPDSTQLIELWNEDKEMLKEKDFRDDPWRLAYNAYLCGFGRGVAIKRQEQPEVDLDAPKEIYVPLVDMGIEDGGIQPSPIWWKRDKSTEKQDCKGVVKYIRADLAELTFDDLEKLDKIKGDVWHEGGFKDLQETFYAEALRRFNDYKAGRK